MLRRLSQRERLEHLVSEWTPAIKSAFIAAFERIKAGVTKAQLKLIIEELAAGQIESAIALLNIDQAAFGELEIAITDAFNAGGIAATENMALRGPSGAKVSINFGVRNPVAEAILRNYSAAEVTNVTSAQIESLRIGLSEGLARGDNPTRSALDMVGRVNRVTGKREGGYLGLDAVQERTQAKALSAMISGDVAGMRGYLALKQRDVRFDAMVRKAMKVGWEQVTADFNKRTKGEPVTARGLQSRIIGRLNDRQLKYRADRLALHETFQALGMAKNEAFRQAIAAGKVDARDVTKTWRHTPQEAPRMQHVAMNGQKVAFDQPFIAPDGTPIMHPHAEGIPTSHSVGCKCRCDYSIDHTAALIRRREN